MNSQNNIPLISVCVANYNGEEIIAACIQSILDQVDAPTFEIIVHDDASTDGSLAVIEAFESARIIRSSENVGFCVSNNRMADAARGKFLLLLNNDAQLYPDALATLVKQSRRHGDEAVLGLPQYNVKDRELVDFGLRLDCFASSVPIKQATEGEVAAVIGACLWLPRELWDRIGGFPEWFETNAEDVYLCCYARFLGYKIFVPNQSGFLHVIGYSQGGGKPDDKKLTISIRRRYFSERNRLFVQWLFYPAWVIPFTTAANLAVLSVEAIVLAIANRKLSLISDIYIKSQHDALSMMGRVKCARRSIMHSRAISFSSFFATFTAVPQKLRLLLSMGVPKT